MGVVFYLIRWREGEGGVGSLPEGLIVGLEVARLVGPDPPPPPPLTDRHTHDSHPP